LTLADMRALYDGTLLFELAGRAPPPALFGPTPEGEELLRRRRGSFERVTSKQKNLIINFCLLAQHACRVRVPALKSALKSALGVCALKSALSVRALEHVRTVRALEQTRRHLRPSARLGSLATHDGVAAPRADSQGHRCNDGWDAQQNSVGPLHLGVRAPPRRVQNSQGGEDQAKAGAVREQHREQHAQNHFGRRAFYCAFLPIAKK
jgi:hypothetical protein